ncbi:protein takeout isoform X2 [Halyomorpha halys]|uniref:protein takeout isoform X2 n=1 Tax=Halyomorpha halys TaxID=286706 RepID=UPI0006D4D37D|nr:protein takeout-like isoform X2 [Halyomorpha halys]
MSGNIHLKASYIHVCRRNDPKIDQCIIDSIEDLKPRLAKGIPELDIPSLEPMHLPEIAISKGYNFRASGTDVFVKGASRFKITNFKADIETINYQIGLQIPELRYVANYDVNMKLLSLVLKGRGPMHANTTDVEAVALLKGHKEQRGDKTHVKFDSLDLKLKWKKYYVKLENLFNGDKTLGEAVNHALNENQKEIFDTIKPLAEEVVSEVILEIANKITKKFTFDELFPLK